MTIIHHSYTRTDTPPMRLDGIVWQEWRTLQRIGSLCAWISDDGMIMVRPTPGNGKTWRASRWSHITKVTITIPTRYKTREAAMKNITAAHYGATR